jgi:subtilisin-like proprotein convertase family protein
VAGYNQGSLQKGDAAGNYTNSFGGTSSACPGVAGVAALIVARNPALRWDQVREILRQSCVRIDPAGGNYDANGRSPFYGYGRVNARKAVELALPAQPLPSIIFKVVQDVPINDFQTARLTLPVAGQGALKTIKVAVDLDHTYIGDLVLTLIPPAAMGAAPVVLHDRAGSSTDNIKTTYDEVNKPALSSLKGKDPSGTWTLEVADKAGQDTGTLHSLRLELTF